ncbi:MAG: hypothetical protein KJ905_00170 [Nanoarchaeota archaeon]|nr:hypothetical protein [Nanoarchaeota archaeon]MBU1501176.1 hypothetical protein [Nanoarchaeota archaeon]
MPYKCDKCGEYFFDKKEAKKHEKGCTRELAEVNKQVLKYKGKITSNIIILVFGIIITFTMVGAIVGIPLIVLSTIFIFRHRSRVENLEITKARIEDKIKS